VRHRLCVTAFVGDAPDGNPSAPDGGNMANPENVVTCHWLTPTRLMPRPYWVEAGAKPWTCLRDGYPRPLNMRELDDCAACPRREGRGFDAAKRDMVFETWGVGAPFPEHRTFDEVRRDIVMETWGI